MMTRDERGLSKGTSRRMQTAEARDRCADDPHDLNSREEGGEGSGLSRACLFSRGSRPRGIAL